LTVCEGDPNLFCSCVVATLCVLGVGRVFLIASGSETPFISAGCPLTSVCQQQSSKRCVPLKLFARAPGDTKFKLCELLNGETLDRFMTLLDDLSEDRVFITFQSVLLFPNVINPGELYATPCEFAKCFGLVLAPQHNHWVCFNTFSATCGALPSATSISLTVDAGLCLRRRVSTCMILTDTPPGPKICSIGWQVQGRHWSSHLWKT